MRRPFYFGTNLKMHQTSGESHAFVEALGRRLPDEDAQCFVLPPFTSLQGLAAIGRRSGVKVGAQNAHFAASGAYTGEISVGMLGALDLDLVMIGHAERRRDFGESDDLIAKKTRSVLQSDLTLLLCVGEDRTERVAGRTDATLRRQLQSALEPARDNPLAQIWVAYEPVWSIGEGSLPATLGDIEPAVATIRESLVEILGTERGTATPLLYGGSVDRDNCAGYAGLQGIDGLFVGRAAWTVDGYLDVLARGLAARRAS